MLYKHSQTFCTKDQLISKLAEPLTDLRMSSAKQLFRFNFEVQCSPETNQLQTVLEGVNDFLKKQVKERSCVPAVNMDEKGNFEDKKRSMEC